MPGECQSGTPRDLTQMSLEDLMEVQVTSVSKKEQKLSKAAAAVFVITQEDIRRSGAVNIPDLLRMVPGVNVAQVDQNRWAISIRGFADMYGDKVLVLMDGRSVYTNSISGVYWDEVDMPLEDVERIEVIRGPGGTVWGANAVNGVINIITKHSRDTHGGMVSAGSGSQTTASGAIQYGGAAGTAGDYRVFGKYSDTDSSMFAPGERAADGWRSSHAGFRSDWNLPGRDTLTVEGDVQQNQGGQTTTDIVMPLSFPETETFNSLTRYTAGDVLARWNHTLENGSDMSLQIYDTSYSRLDQGVHDTSNTVDVDFQHHLRAGSRHDVVWGLEYRFWGDRMTPGFNVSLFPPYRADNLVSAFVQDEIRLSDSLSFTVGSKFEHNSYTGFEYEPGAQLAWDFTQRQTLWISAARAIRQPTRRDVDLSVIAGVVPLGNDQFAVTQVMGAQYITPEELRDFEAGHRAQISDRLSVDSVLFLSLYRNLETLEPLNPYFTFTDGPPHLVLPMAFAFTGRAENYGAEFSASVVSAN